MISARMPGPDFDVDLCMSLSKQIVYIIKSSSAENEYYVGVTSDFRSRLAAHNPGLSPHTARHRDWRALVVVEFDERSRRCSVSGI